MLKKEHEAKEQAEKEEKEQMATARAILVIQKSWRGQKVSYCILIKK